MWNTCLISQFHNLGLRSKKTPQQNEYEISLKTLKSHLTLKYYYCQQSNCIITFLFLCLVDINVCKLDLPSSSAHTFFKKFLLELQNVLVEE